MRRLRTFLTLFRCFILRVFLREKLRIAVTVLGVALGVAVMVAVRLGNRTALESFQQATESVTGATSLEIVGTAGPFDEMLAKDLLWLKDYGRMTPVIDGYALYGGGESAETAPEFLRILGIDILRDRDVRRYRLLRFHRQGQEATGREFLRLLRESDAIILTEKFSARRGIDVGDRITLTFNDEPRTLTVRGLLLDEGPARASSGNFALMDIAAAQVALRRIGMLDRLDVKLAPDVDLDEALIAIRSRLPPGLAVRPPAERYRQVETMIAAFHFNLSALGSLALLVGLFLIYNSVAISTLRRRREIGIVRAVGSTRSLVFMLFLCEALLVATVGAALGMPLGRILARGAVEATAATVETFYIAEAATAGAAAERLTWTDLALGFGLTLPLALAAAFVPSREATRVSPLEAALARGIGGASAAPPLAQTLVALALFAVACLCSSLPPWSGLPVWGYAGAIALLLAAAFLLPTTLWGICRTVRKLVSGSRRQIAIAAELASANLTSALPRVSVSVAALAVSLAMMISVSIMISSFRETVVYWVGQTLRADLFVKPISLTSAAGESSIAMSAVERIRRDPRVAAVDRFTSRVMGFRGRAINVGAADLVVLLEHGRLAFKSPPDAPERLKEAIDHDALLVSESFSLRFQAHPGDRVALPTARGDHEFTVAAVFYDYSNNRGKVVMDRSTYRRYFEPDREETVVRSVAVYLHAGADPDAVRSDLLEALGRNHRLVIATQPDIRREVLRIFDSTFTITYALQVIAIVISALGVISTLFTLILDRRREISLLSVVGAAAGQIRRVIVIEAVLIGAVSLVVGVAVGTLLSLVLIFVINVQSFGWTIQYHFPWSFLAQVTGGILIATGLAGLYPAASATRRSGVQHLREE